jgi:O-methyltransferase involved in polyketide biosynthesis
VSDDVVKKDIVKYGVYMSKPANQNMSGLSETYLASLYWKAMESQRPDAMIKDEKAVALITQKNLGFSRIRRSQ